MQERQVLNGHILAADEQHQVADRVFGGEGTTEWQAHFFGQPLVWKRDPYDVNAYNVDVLARPGAEHVDDPKGFAHKLVERGGAIIGTPDDAVEAIWKLHDLAGGFGTFVGFMHDWSNLEARNRSYDLFARYVIPQVQGLIKPVQTSRDALASNNKVLMKAAGEGILKAIREHNAAHPRA